MCLQMAMFCFFCGIHSIVCITTFSVSIHLLMDILRTMPLWSSNPSNLDESEKWMWQLLSHVWLCDPTDWSSPGSSVHEILQARILEWVAILFSRASPLPRGWTQVSCIAGGFFTIWATKTSSYWFKFFGRDDMVQRQWIWSACVYICVYVCTYIHSYKCMCIYVYMFVCVWGGGARMSVWLGAADGFYQEDMSVGRNKSTCV